MRRDHVIAMAACSGLMMLMVCGCGGKAEVDSEASVSENNSVKSLFDLRTQTLEGEPVALSDWQGKTALVVNVASRCGMTPQYAGLQALYEELAPRGFVILGFPSNDFLGQEPGTPAEIREFCQANYGVTFPLFEKVRVKGEEKSEIYRFLSQGHEEPSWNFTKYLVDPSGKVVQRFDPRTKPDDPALRQAILALLEDES